MNGSYSDKFNVWGIGLLLTTWLISVGAVVVILFSAQFISKVFLPAVVLACQFVLMRRARAGRDSKKGYCYVLPFLMSRVLFVTVIIMVAINIYYMGFIPDEKFADGSVNRSIPYITILIVAPVSSAVMLWAMYRGHHLSYCYQCRATYGLPAERGFIGRVFNNESHYQLRLLTIVSIIATVYSWTYYLVRYSNANMNSADKFYFNYIPLIFYLFSGAYMVMHYWSLFAFYQKNIVADTGSDESNTLVRFILICGDSVFLSEKKTNSGEFEPGKEVFDTPFVQKYYFRQHLGEQDAYGIFSKMIGRDVKFELRFLYENQNINGNSNIFHFLCQIDRRSAIEHAGVGGTWYGQAQMGRLFDARMVDVMLAGEIRRVSQMANAYKAYDSNGKRLYQVRHYRPSFTFKELMHLDVDFNDPTWLFVAEDNEDSRFFKIRRFFKKYVGGFDM